MSPAPMGSASMFGGAERIDGERDLREAEGPRAQLPLCGYP